MGALQARVVACVPVLVAGLSVSVAATLAGAAPVSAVFTGEVTRVLDPGPGDPLLPSTFVAGAPVSGSFSYDPSEMARLDPDPNGPYTASYVPNVFFPKTAMQLDVGSVHLQAVPGTLLN